LRTKTKAVSETEVRKTPNKERIREIIKKPKEKFLTNSQKEYWDVLGENEITICIGPAGVGKAQPLDSIVYTPTGEKTMGEIEVGDYVIGDDGKKCTVIATHPQGIKPIYRVTFSDGSFTETCNEHLWFTQTEKDRNNRVKVKGKRYRKPLEGSVKELSEIKNSIHSSRGCKNHSIPITNPVHFNEIPLFVNPYLMGVLLGDGGLSQEKITFTNIDSEIIENVYNSVPESCIMNKIKSAKYGYSITSKKLGGSQNDMLNEIRNCGLNSTKSNNKFIPKKYLFNSVENRIKLLQGLLDTDGYVNKKGTSIFFTTISFQLMSDVKFLVNSLGGIAYVSEKLPFYKDKNGNKIICNLAYTLTINLPNEIQPFGISRKLKLVKQKTKYKPKRFITNVEYVGEKEAKCITIDSKRQLYLTDNFIVTHNSYIAMKKAIDLLHDDKNKYEKIIIVRPAVEAEEKLGSLPGDLEQKLDPYIFPSYYLLNKIIGKQARERLKNEEFIEVAALAYMRGWNVDNSILIFEEAQNSTIGQMKLLLTRIGFNSKFFISGDLEQSDKFKNIEHSGLYDAKKRMEGLPNIGVYEFKNPKDIVRNPLISEILNRYD
jgi:phosphate starvation-inducible protein PhoH